METLLDAHSVYRQWLDVCKLSTGIGNSYTVNGERYILTRSRGRDDDAVTGKVSRVTAAYDDVTQAVKCGTFRIEANGEVTRWPVSLKTLVLA